MAMTWQAISISSINNKRMILLRMLESVNCVYQSLRLALQLKGESLSILVFSTIFYVGNQLRSRFLFNGDFVVLF